MVVVRTLAAALGVVLVIFAGWSVIGTLVVPRRVRSALTRLVAVSVRRVFKLIADRCESYAGRDRVLAFQAPVQLVAQIVAWLASFELGFGLLLWPFVSSGGLGAALVQAGSSLCTLGYAAPGARGPAALDDLAALAGLGTVALQIGYLPTLYAAFNRRETLVAMLQSRAGVPSWGPELLARTHYGLGTGVSGVDELPALFEQWENWSADVSESHSTYPTLMAFRSPNPLASWITAQLAVLDAAALYLSLLGEPQGAITARLCLRGGFTCLRTVAVAVGVTVVDDPDPDQGITLTYDEFAQAVARLRAVDFPIARPPEDAWPDFVGWRVNYEAAAYAIAYRVNAPPALWSGPRQWLAVPIPPVRPQTRVATKSPSAPDGSRGTSGGLRGDAASAPESPDELP
jgi:hypothetical protein